MMNLRRQQELEEQRKNKSENTDRYMIVNRGGKIMRVNIDEEKRR